MPCLLNRLATTPLHYPRVREVRSQRVFKTVLPHAYPQRDVKANRNPPESGNHPYWWRRQTAHSHQHGILIILYKLGHCERVACCESQIRKQQHSQTNPCLDTSDFIFWRRDVLVKESERESAFHSNHFSGFFMKRLLGGKRDLIRSIELRVVVSGSDPKFESMLTRFYTI